LAATEYLVTRESTPENEKVIFFGKLTEKVNQLLMRMGILACEIDFNEKVVQLQFQNHLFIIHILSIMNRAQVRATCL
jgi:hypothetical protein